jgi:hypothetical protein
MSLADFTVLGTQATANPTPENVDAFKNYKGLTPMWYDPLIQMGAGALIGGAAFGGFGGTGGAPLGAEGSSIGSGAVLDPTGLGAGDIAFSSGGLGLSSAAAGGAILDPTGLGAGEVPGAAVAPAGGATPISMLNASSPTTALDPATATALGISTNDSVFGGPAFQSAGGTMAGGAPTFGENAFGGGYVGEPTGQWGGPTGMDAGAGAGALDTTAAWLKKLGLTPATAGLLGVSAAQALSKPKLPQAAQDLQKQGTAGAAAASGVIQSGGTSGPAWATQKASIDATIDQQLKEQAQAMLQQAQNSGVGADSQVTQQQINKLKTQLETARQQLYAQAQAQNVQNALKELGISDQALAQVADTQFRQSAAARQGAAQTASLALMLATLGKA